MGIKKKQIISTKISKQMFKDLLGAKLLSKEGEVDTETRLSGLDAVGIYFSAHWCPPCRGFTPVLAEKYNKLKEAGKKFEIVFASSDSGQDSFDDYYKEMPWLAIPYSERDLKGTLSDKYGVSGIPCFVVLDGTNCEVITKNGRSGVSGDDFIETFPWHPQLIGNMETDMDGIDEGKAFLLIQDAISPEAQKANMEWLTSMAEANKTSKTFGRMFVCNGGARASFFKEQLGIEVVKLRHPHPLEKLEGGQNTWGCDGCGKGGANFKERHRDAANDFDLCENCLPLQADLPTEVPDNMKFASVRVLELSAQQYYCPAEGKTEVNEANVKAMIQDLADGKLTGKTLGEK